MSHDPRAPDFDPHHHVAMRDMQVSELIDEIVHMEQDHIAYEKDLTAKLEYSTQLCENALSYSMLLEQAVIVPAVGSLDNYIASSPALGRNVGAARNRLQQSAGSSVGTNSERLQQLLEQCRNAPDFGKAKQRREQILNNILSRATTKHQGGASVGVDIEDSLVLLECLLEQQQQLGVLLADTSKRLTGKQPFEPPASSGGGGGDSAAAQAAATQAAESLKTKESEVAVLQAQVKHLEQLNATNTSKLQVADEEIARLSKAARSTGAIEELQKHYQQQEEKYLQKIEAMEKDKENRHQERVAEAARIESLQRIIEDGNEERNVMRAEMDRLRGLAVQATGQAAARSSSGRSASGTGADSAGEHSLRMELERNIREHSTVTTQLEGEIAQLRADLVSAQHEAAGAAAQRTHLEQLHRNNELLRQEIAQLQSRISAHDTNSTQREADAEKVAAMESTIQQLSDEVTAVDARIRAMHAQHIAERERLQQQLERERARFQQERDECDALVWRMTSELEFLVKDNALYKAKLDGLQDELQGY